MIDEAGFDGLVGALYGTIAEPTSWDAVLVKFRSAFQCSGIALQSSDGRREMSFSTEPEESRRYLAHWAGRNPLVTSTLPVGAVVTDDQVVDRERFERSAYCNEFLRPIDMSRLLFVQGIATADGSATLNIMRSSKGRDFTSVELRAAARLSPHLASVLQTTNLLRWRDWKTLMETSEEAAEGIALVDVDGRLLHMNRQARTLTAARDGLCVTPSGLDAVLGGSARRLRQAIGRAIGAGAAVPAGAMLSIERASGARPLIVSITPLPDRLPDIGVPRPRAMIAILDPDQPADAPRADLQSLFGLTPREAAVAQALGDGLSIAEAAVRCGVTLATARNYLARVMRKTDVARQGDLVLLLGRVARLSQLAKP